MTSFADYETSVAGSRPLEIYEFTADGSTTRYTSAATDLTVGVNTYTAIPIRRSAITTSQGRKDTLTITFSRDNSYALGFLNANPAAITTVAIYRLQVDETPTFNTKALIYKGTLSSGNYAKGGEEISLLCRSIESVSGKPMPDLKFMGMCNHTLFDNQCGVSTTGFSLLLAPVTAVSGTVITVTGANSQADGYWAGGWCKPSGLNEFRMVISHSGNDLTVLLPFTQNITGSQIDVYAGCDHRFDGDCSNKFDNVLNFGGFPYVPTKNPFATGID